LKEGRKKENPDILGKRVARTAGLVNKCFTGESMCKRRKDIRETERQ